MLVLDFLQLANPLPEMLILLDGDGRILAANRQALKILKKTAPDPIGLYLNEFLLNVEGVSEPTMRIWRQSASPVPIKIEWKSLSAETTEVMQCQGFLLQPAVKGESMQLVLRCVVGKSIRNDFIALNQELERHKTLLRKLQTSRKALEKEHEKALVTLYSIGDAVITTDANGLVEYLNPVAENLTGRKRSESIGKPIENIFVIVNELTRRVAPNPVHRCLAEGRIVGLANHTVIIAKDDTEYVIEDSAAPIRNHLGETLGVVLVFRDVTDDRLARRQLEYLSQHDTVTGLKNRYFFEQQLEHTVDVVSRGNRLAALLYIDLDQFKVINDTAGHTIGDEFLGKVARSFSGCARSGDILARLGGDEFGVILHDIQPEQLETIIQSYVQALHGFRFQWEEGFYDVTCSIGVALIDQFVKLPAEAMRQADIACFIAKRDGRNRFHIYHQEDEKSISTLSEINTVNRIKSALINNEFVLFFQPIKDVASDSIEMCEVLVRLRRSDGSLASPGYFIPVAERYGLMNKLDVRVISLVLDILIKGGDGVAGKIFTINLSGASLGDGEILGMLKDFATRHLHLAGQIILEITETSAVTHIEKASFFISELRELGIRFALDDFGTGFSSFSYLKHLPVEYIKIDGTFVRDIVDDPMDQAMVRSINHIAHTLHKKTIAEFVENDAILKLLIEIGVDMLQGYHIGKPAPEII